jgi:hypothetical protein
MKSRHLQRLVLAAAVLLAPRAALAVTHTTQISTNMENYRVCADPTLGTCTYDEIRSPSEYYIPDGNKISVYLKSDGKVDIKSDALSIDSGLPAAACSYEDYACVASQCADGPFKAKPCSYTTCIGGPNSGGSCAAGGPSACPGGFCRGNVCGDYTCQGGPQDNRRCLQAYATTDCNDFFDDHVGADYLGTAFPGASQGWYVLFRGNTQALVFDYNGGVLYNVDELQGATNPPLNPNMGPGCLMKCPFGVDNTGSNTANITCTTEGDCTSVKLFHSIEILDPQGHTMAVSALGTATITRAAGTIGTQGDTGDPAKYGDACRTEHPAPADCP